MNKHICPYCNKEFKTGAALGGHIVNCKSNPNINLYNASRKEGKITSSKSKKNRTLICEVCGNEYTVAMTDDVFNKKTYKKTCCRKCASLLSKAHTDLNERNNKIRVCIDSKHKELGLGIYKIQYCEVCGNVIPIEYKSHRFCCDSCREISRSLKLSKCAIERGFGGLNPKSFNKCKRGWYKGIFCDSSWELAFVIYSLDHDMNISRYDGYLEYEFKGKIYKYYPDFIIDDDIYEIKGFYNEQAKVKAATFPWIKIIDKNSIKKYIDYAKSKYGNNYTELFEKNKLQD